MLGIFQISRICLLREETDVCTSNKNSSLARFGGYIGPASGFGWTTYGPERNDERGRCERLATGQSRAKNSSNSALPRRLVLPRGPTIGSMASPTLSPPPTPVSGGRRRATCFHGPAFFCSAPTRPSSYPSADPLGLSRTGLPSTAGHGCNNAPVVQRRTQANLGKQSRLGLLPFSTNTKSPSPGRGRALVDGTR